MLWIQLSLLRHFTSLGGQAPRVLVLKNSQKLTKFGRHVQYGCKCIMHDINATDTAPPANPHNWKNYGHPVSCTCTKFLPHIYHVMLNKLFHNVPYSVCHFTIELGSWRVLIPNWSDLCFMKMKLIIIQVLFFPYGTMANNAKYKF